MAFGKADIKEHDVSLYFEEWNQVEEGQPLPRVWARIYHLPQKLREFSVLWALGSMLGATTSVDMISSLKDDYGRVQIAVLDASLLPSIIDSVVIGDRLYNLPILVEGRDEVPNENNIEVDHDNNGSGGSGHKKD